MAAVTLDAGDVRLRPYVPDDEEALVSLLGDPELMRLALTERALTRHEARRFVRDLFTGDHVYRFEPLCLKDTGAVIGFGGYRACHYLGCEDVEFGWVIAAPHQGRGYATAVGQTLITHAIELGLWRIVGACHPQNVVSEHVLRDKLVMRFRREVEPAPGFRRRVYTLARRPRLQTAALQDLETAASWISTAEECERWAGPAVRFPLDPGGLAAALAFGERESLRLVDAGQQLVSFGQFDVRASRRGHLSRLIVNPLLRGQGIGETLVNGLIVHARNEGCARVSLTVQVGNDAAIALYQRLGFVDATRPEDAPRPGARYMELIL